MDETSLNEGADIVANTRADCLQRFDYSGEPALGALASSHADRKAQDYVNVLR